MQFHNLLLLLYTNINLAIYVDESISLTSPTPRNDRDAKDNGETIMT